VLTLYDYLPSQNGWKVRQLLHHLDVPYRTVLVSIFEGEGRRPEYLAINPTGAVPAIRFDDGRTLSESNAILFHLAEGSQWLAQDAFLRAKTLQWLSFEADYVQSTLGAVRHWRMTGKLDRRPRELVSSRVAAGEAALAALDRVLADSDYLVGDYGIADISMFAYAHLAEEAGVELTTYGNVTAWIERVRSRSGHLSERFGYDVDPHSAGELP